MKSGTTDETGVRGAESVREKYYKFNHEKAMPHELKNIKKEDIRKITHKHQ